MSDKQINSTLRLKYDVAIPNDGNDGWRRSLRKNRASELFNLARPCIHFKIEVVKYLRII